jgi:hypothetical protein
MNSWDEDSYSWVRTTYDIIHTAIMNVLKDDHG